MKKQSSKKSTERSTRSSRKRIWSLSRVLQLMVIAVCLCAAYVSWLDYRIHTEFEGRRWSIPARVYARPHDIYIGQELARAGLDRTLRANNYQLRPNLTGPGQYRRIANGYEIYLRAFDYWDGQVAAGRYMIEASGGQVTRIVEVDSGEVLPVVRMDPELIGKIYPDHNEDRVLVGLNDVPPFLVQALLAVEDHDFYRHVGLDLRGIFRAFWVNLQSGELTQGGSTLTQQLVKNFFLTRERTFTRKVNEMIMAMLLERRYEKNEILLAYLNEVYLGQDKARGIHGFGSASEFYFNRPLAELREDQLALLAGLVRGASYYNPRRYPDRALSRRNLVLNAMLGQGYLDTDSAQTLKDRSLEISERPGGVQSKYPAFLELARRQLLQDYQVGDLQNEGLRIYTTLDPSLQDHLDQAVEKRLAGLEQQNTLKPGSLESASVLVEISNGEVLALSGGRDPAQAGFNRALDAKRPIGSLIKPFIYLTALSYPDRYNLLSVLADTKLSIKQPDGSVWEPNNYDHTSHGPVSLMESMIHSYNLATVRLGLNTGLDNIIRTLAQAGLDTPVNPYPSLLLGAVDLSPYTVAQMYQTIANGGYLVPLNAIREVLDNEGEPLQRHDLNIVQALDQTPVYLTNYLLTKVVELGTAHQLSTSLGPGMVLAGKTGTTNESRDSWYAGYGDNVLAITWLGRDDNLPTPFTGASGAMLIWSNIMKPISIRPLTLVEPETISWTREISLLFAGTCFEAGRIPYTGDFVPENKLACRSEWDPGKSMFNPFNWLR